jgi:copper homeostasis protein
MPHRHMDSPRPKILLEVCVGSAADVDAAIAAGADRVELCAALELGGLTPSIGLIEVVVARCPLPVIALLRPRAGGFAYDMAEFDTMLADMKRSIEAGVAGFAFGVLDQRGGVDAVRAREIVDRAAPLETVFHRAFDFIADQPAAIDKLIEVGCTRVLTSGGKPTAREGIQSIRRLIDHSAGRLQILPAGGIQAGHVLEIVRGTGCTQIHVGASRPSHDGSLRTAAQIQLQDPKYFEGFAHRAVDPAAVAATTASLGQYGKSEH